MSGTALASPEQNRPWLLTPKGELAAALVAGGCLLAGWVLQRTAADASNPHLAGHLLAYAALAIGLFHGSRAAIAALRGGAFDIDVLMVVGAVLAAWIGAPSEGALLLFLFVLAGALEDLAMARTTRAVEALSKLMPSKAIRWDGHDWTDVAPETLVPGDRVRILPGELIPADATLSLGATSIDTATLTGESMPRDVAVGDELFAGTLNVGNPVEAVVSRPASESSLQRIVNLVTQAQQQREPVQRLIDRVSQPYAIGVFATAIATFLVWYFALDFPVKEAVYTAITLLIVASPCALIISTPTATLAAISRAARAGVLFKGGAAIERLARMQAIAFDKTGTLTVGRPRVMQVHPVGWSAGSDLLAVAAGLEQTSTHPIAAAIVDAAQARGVAPAHADEVTYVPGRGVVGFFGGKEARLGSLKHTEELIPVCLRQRVRELLDVIQHGGQIGTVIAYDEGAAVFILTDATRPGAECLVAQLHGLGVRPVVMLTGDNTATARRVAETLKLDEFHAELLPQDKVDRVQGLKRAGEQTSRPADQKGDGGGVGVGGWVGSHPRGVRCVGVIGDGVNDAPALAAADVSIAIGSIGSDAALESADIVLLADDLSAVPWATALARRGRRTIKVNLIFSLGAIVVMVGATWAGSLLGRPLPLWLGVIGHEGGTLLVVCHSLLLLAYPGVSTELCPKPMRLGVPTGANETKGAKNLPVVSPS